MALNRLTQRRIPDFLTKDKDTADFMQALIDQQSGNATTVTFQTLSDGFAFAGHALEQVRVNAGATALEPFTPAASTTTFTSTNQTITPATTLVIPHGLGAEPKKLSAFLVCQTAENGYSIGDVVAINIGAVIYTTAASALRAIGMTVKVDATNLTVVYGTGDTTVAPAPVFQIMNAATFLVSACVNANWSLRLVATL